MDLKSKIILIYGPTASGKSNFAIKLSKKINNAVIVTVICDRGDRYLSTGIFEN